MLTRFLAYGFLTVLVIHGDLKGQRRPTNEQDPCGCLASSPSSDSDRGRLKRCLDQCEQTTNSEKK